MELESIRIFVKVIQLGSFSKAATLLRLPKSTVSRTVKHLEEDTGTRLLTRTTRSLTLTASGRAFYETCIDPIHVLEEARKSLVGSDSIMAGSVRITAPEDMGGVLCAEIAKLGLEFPGLTFDLNYTNEVVDLVTEGYDFAIRIGKLNPSRFKVRRLGEIVLRLVASAKYLAKHGTPASPRELSDHACLTYNPRSSHAKWELRSKGGKTSVSIQPKVLSNQMTTLVELAKHGSGIALVPSYLAYGEKTLVPVLPGWWQSGYPISLVSPTVGSSSRLRILSDRLSAAVQNVLASING